MAAGDTRHGEYKVPGGKLVVVDLSIVEGLLARVQVSGDFFLEPPSALDAINAALEGLPVESGQGLLATEIRIALGTTSQMFGFTPEAIAVAVQRALNANPITPDGGGEP